MQDNEQFDGRDLRNGGWFWAQRELLTVFAPLIGHHACWIYMVMTDLVPEKARNPLFDLSVRRIQQATGGTLGLSVGMVHRELAMMRAIGMIEVQERGRGQTPMYKLVDLRKLAAVGIEELSRRLSVHRVNTGKDKGAMGSARTDSRKRVDIAAGSDESQVSTTKEEDAAAVSPEGSGGTGVHGVNTSASPVEKQEDEGQVFTKRGGSVHKTGGVCSPHERPLINKSIHLKDLTPLPPSAKGERLPSVAASGKVPEEAPPERAATPGSAARSELDQAVAKVARECGLSSPRMEPVIRRALELHAARTDEVPVWNALAELAIRNYHTFCVDLDLMSVKIGARKFFDDGLAFNQRKWPYDQKLLRETRNRRL